MWVCAPIAYPLAKVRCFYMTLLRDVQLNSNSNFEVCEANIF